MYEQGINQAWEATPLGGGTSSGVHESQSRLWENLVGRSLDFWALLLPAACSRSSRRNCGADPLETFHRAINKAQRSLIRTDADELTYNLHVMIRFGLEADMLEGRLAVKDLPDAWNAAYRRDLGIEPPDDRDGVHAGRPLVRLPDRRRVPGLHVGQHHERACSTMRRCKAHPEIPAEMREGRFDTLLGWLRENIYRYGSKYTAAELVQRVTGGELTIEPYIAT